MSEIMNLVNSMRVLSQMNVECDSHITHLLSHIKSLHSLGTSLESLHKITSDSHNCVTHLRYWELCTKKQIDRSNMPFDQMAIFINNKYTAVMHTVCFNDEFESEYFYLNGNKVGYSGLTLETHEEELCLMRKALDKHNWNNKRLIPT